MLTHRITRGWTPGSGNGFSATQELQADGEDNRSITVPANTADKQVALALDVSQLKALCLLSDKAVVIETNSSGSPVNTFSLAAGVPFVWAYGDAPLRDTAGTAVTTDITTIYITNDGDDDAEVKIGVLVDSTLT